MSDEPPRTRRAKSSRLSASRGGGEFSSQGGDNISETVDGGRNNRSTASPAPSGTSSNTGGEDDVVGAGGELLKMRRSCDYCVRMKRACDGKTPCELCTRRNKDCTRSVKKKSGPAKGTKYAARRTRSQEDHHHLLSPGSAAGLGRLGGGSGTLDGAGATTGAAGAAFINPPPQRPASAGDRRNTPPSGRGGPGNAGRGLSSSSSALGSSVSTSLSFVQPDQEVLGHATGVVAGAIGEGVAGEAGGRGGSAGLGMGQQHGGGSGLGGDSESQQLISTFPGVLQDPSIWDGPSPEELRIVGDMETSALGGAASGVDQRFGNESMARVVRPWDGGPGDVLHSGGGARGGLGGMGLDCRSQSMPDATVTSMSQRSTRAMRHDDRGTSAGSSGHAFAGGEWVPGFPRQQNRRSSAGTMDDQPHYFPQAFRRAQPTQSQLQHQRGSALSSSAYPVHDIFRNEGYPASALQTPRVGAGGGAGGRIGGTPQSLPPLGRNGRSGLQGVRDSTGSFDDGSRAVYSSTDTTRRAGSGGGEGGIGGSGGIGGVGFGFGPPDPGGGTGGGEQMGVGADAEGDSFPSPPIRIGEFPPPGTDAFMVGAQQYPLQMQWHQQQQQQQQSWQMQRFPQARLPPLHLPPPGPSAGMGGSSADPSSTGDDLSSAGTQSPRTPGVRGRGLMTSIAHSASGDGNGSQDLYGVAESAAMTPTSPSRHQDSSWGRPGMGTPWVLHGAAAGSAQMQPSPSLQPSSLNPLMPPAPGLRDTGAGGGGWRAPGGGVGEEDSPMRTDDDLPGAGGHGSNV